MSEELWTVTVTEDATGDVVRKTTVQGQRRAEKIADGLSINLNHDRFSVTVDRDGGEG